MQELVVAWLVPGLVAGHDADLPLVSPNRRDSDLEKSCYGTFPVSRLTHGRTVDMARSRGLATGVLIFASFKDLMDATIVNVAQPSIEQDLHATPAQLEWTVGGYLLAFAVLMVTGGRLGDIFGRQRIFVLGVAGFTLGS